MLFLAVDTWPMSIPWYWDEENQTGFGNINATFAKDVDLSYPDYSKEFEIYNDASSKQLGSVLTQGNKPLVFFSRNSCFLWQNIVVNATRIQCDQN